MATLTQRKRLSQGNAVGEGSGLSRTALAALEEARDVLSAIIDGVREADRGRALYRVEVRERGEGSGVPARRRFIAWLEDVAPAHPSAAMVVSGEGPTLLAALYDLEDRAEKRAWGRGEMPGRQRCSAALAVITRAIERAERGTV